ncbi:hypothetical protein G6L68_21320 [Agrobacterium fabrum]|nr:hypothetical protein [Agrobacterium fabrum]NTE63202.1 hypothetical protein [Agrobacterium fabrum]
MRNTSASLHRDRSETLTPPKPPEAIHAAPEVDRLSAAMIFTPLDELR